MLFESTEQGAAEIKRTVVNGEGPNQSGKYDARICVWWSAVVAGVAFSKEYPICVWHLKRKKIQLFELFLSSLKYRFHASSIESILS